MIIKVENIQSLILFIRGERVILDFHLANVYQVENRVLKQAVRRNTDRFPDDFMFQLNKEEFQQVITICDNLPLNIKFSPSLPFAFTEQGVAMLSSVLKSQLAIQANITIMRAFVNMRTLLTEHIELRRQIENLESKYDQQFKVVFEAIKQLIHQKNEPRELIGFKTGKNN